MPEIEVNSAAALRQVCEYLRINGSKGIVNPAVIMRGKNRVWQIQWHANGPSLKQVREQAHQVSTVAGVKTLAKNLSLSRHEELRQLASLKLDAPNGPQTQATFDQFDRIVIPRDALEELLAVFAGENEDDRSLTIVEVQHGSETPSVFIASMTEQSLEAMESALNKMRQDEASSVEAYELYSNAPIYNTHVDIISELVQITSDDTKAEDYL